MSAHQFISCNQYVDADPLEYLTNGCHGLTCHGEIGRRLLHHCPQLVLGKTCKEKVVRRVLVVLAIVARIVTASSELLTGELASHLPHAT